MLIDKLREEAHVWLIIPENITCPQTITQFYALLSADEIDQHNRFHFPADKHRYLVSHAWVRNVLAKYLKRPASDLKFRFTSKGKPEVLLNDYEPQLRFNLTHTTGLAACIVTRDDDCGIDAEIMVKKTAALDVARLMFSQNEYKRLQGLHGRCYLENFFISWTLREAYVKALGQGIDFPTNKLLFNLKNTTDIDVSFQDKVGDVKQNWQFQVMRPTSDHIMTVAINNARRNQKKIILNWN